MRTKLAVLPLLTLLAVLLGVVAPASARRDRTPEIVTVEEGEYLRLHFADNEAAQGWLWRPPLDEDDLAERPVDLIVALHGAGGNPQNFVMPRLMRARRAYCLTVAGREQVETDRGRGFMWSGSDVSTIVALTRWVIAHHPVNAKRVLVWGHSAGGSMTLATLAEAPELFAGGLTTAAPATPTSAHKDLRVAVLLGMDDPNWGGAGAVRSHAERLLKKRAKGQCAFMAIEGLGHEVPLDGYLGLGFDWVLHGAARGGEATGGLRPRGTAGPWRHILVRYKGAEGADGVRRSKSKAAKLLKDVRKALAKGRAFFPFEAAVHSEDEATASGGGGIDEEPLRALLGDLPGLDPDSVSEILESPQGLHLVWREMEED